VILHLDEAVPSRNAVDKLHWTKRQKLRERWQWLIRAALLNQRLQVQRFPMAQIRIERYSPRKLDDDNFVGGAKQLVDALKHLGFIVDDTAKHVRIEYVQLSGPPATRVWIDAG
jgi:hypothetical protein